MTTYKIGELAKLLNIKIDTIRYYEKIALIPKPERKENDYRIYSKQYVELISFIILCKNNGFTLKEIKEIIDLLNANDSNDQLKSIVHEKLYGIDQKIQELNLLKSKLNEVVEICDLDDCTLLDFLK